MAETELVLFSLFRVSGFNLDNINIQQLKELVSIIFKSDDIEYSLNNDLIKYVTNEINLLKCRFCLYMDMLKAFCHLNSNLLIQVINRECNVSTIFETASKFCSSYSKPFNNFNFEALKYYCLSVESYFQSWNFKLQEDVIHLWKLTDDTQGNNLVNVKINSDFKWSIRVNDKCCNVDWLELPQLILSINEFKSFLERIYKICICTSTT